MTASRVALTVTLGLTLLAAPLAAGAQQAGKVYRIGYLSAGSAAFAPRGDEKFLQGLRDLGYVEGRDFVMEYRFAEGQPDRLPGLAADLVRAPVDVIVTIGTPATLAAMPATGTIPIVSPVAGTLVEKGIVKSLGRPGGNVTGLTTQVGVLKLYQLLKEAVPKVTRVVYLYDPPPAALQGAENFGLLRQRRSTWTCRWSPCVTPTTLRRRSQNSGAARMG